MALATRDALIQAAEGLMRTKGYAAFSYADLAESVGIKKASIHYHFPTKEQLGIAIVEEYIARVRGEFERIEINQEGVDERLNAYFVLFTSSNDGGVLPLCGALAAEMSALPVELQELTQRFFDVQLTWLTKILDKGVADGQIPPGRGTRQKAFLLLSVLEGSSFVNWAIKENLELNQNVVHLIIHES